MPTSDQMVPALSRNATHSRTATPRLHAFTDFDSQVSSFEDKDVFDDEKEEVDVQVRNDFDGSRDCWVGGILD